MKFLTLLSVFSLVTVPAFGADAPEEKDATDLVNDSMKALMKCDSSGMESAKLALGFTRVTMVEPRATEAEAKEAAAAIDAILDSFEKAKSCEEFRATYAKVEAFTKKYENFDLEAEFNKPEMKEMLKQFAAGLKEQNK